MKGKLGLRAQDTAELSLDGVRVPGSARLGEEGAGLQGRDVGARQRPHLARRRLRRDRAGLPRRVGRATRASATAFKRPIAAFQLVQQLLAEMHVETEAARLLTWRAAALADAGKPYTVEAADREVVRERGGRARRERRRAGARRLRVRGRISCREVPP